MATIQLQRSAGIGWSLHTLAPGEARRVCVCVCVRTCGCVCVCRMKAGETVIGGCTIGGVTRPSPATKREEKSLKWFQAKNLCIKSRNLFCKEEEKKDSLNSKFKVHRRKFLALLLAFAAGVRGNMREGKPLCLKLAGFEFVLDRRSCSDAHHSPWWPTYLPLISSLCWKRLCKYDMYICMFVVIHSTINPKPKLNRRQAALCGTCVWLLSCGLRDHPVGWNEQKRRIDEAALMGDTSKTFCQKVKLLN